ncbi:hypothetical protein AMQ28_05435 [Acinetobacter sp. TTH0-4]|uniref:hypothetical protein n=1 Tax=Acinetobacter sp. TTH0-4 TaxID=1646498 RepID=UPI0006AE1F34|nr:hypothetical protein [Acinetobacter sp. TTH0-4]ALD01852.1 hypothetical protein AMQ28_05435 [Acinetobacter sp. TTH0-4]
MKYLTAKQILDRFNIKSPTTLWRWQQPTQKIFAEPLPKPIKVVKGSTSLWEREQIERWEAKYFRNNESLTT